MYERSGGRKAYRAGRYWLGLTAKAKRVARGDGGAEARGGRQVPARGHRRGHDLPPAEFPAEHRRRIRTNNMIERLNREIRRRTRVVGCFPDGDSALMLVCARIRYVTANEWSSRRYLDMSRLGVTLEEAD